LKIEQEKGQGLVEFALVLIIIVIPVTFMLIETSVILYKYVALTNASREGARAGSIYMYTGGNPPSEALPDAGRSAKVVDAVQGTLGLLIDSPPDCNNTSATTTCQMAYGPSTSPFTYTAFLRSTDLLTVTLTHTHSFLFGALGGEIGLNTQTSMRIEPAVAISGTGP
jgi:hypothetical protein